MHKTDKTHQDNSVKGEIETYPHICCSRGLHIFFQKLQNFMNMKVFVLAHINMIILSHELMYSASN